MSVRPKYMLPVVALWVVLLLQACMPVQPESPGAAEQPAAEAPAAEAPAGEMETVRLVTLPFITFAPFYIAQEEGFYAEQGLNVEFVNLSQQQQVLPALTSGEVDVASGLVESGLLNAIARGGGMKIVADKGYIDPNSCNNFGVFLSSQLEGQVSFDDPETLRGLSVNIPPSSWLDYVWHQLMAPLGLSSADFEYITMPSNTQPEALTQGNLDISFNNEPWITRFREAGHSEIGPQITEAMPEAQFAITFYGPTLINDRVDVGNRFMAAYLKAVRQYSEGATDRNIEIMAPVFGMEPDFLRTICWPAIRNTGEVNLDSIVAYEEWANSAGYLDSVIPAEEFWDGRFVEAANEIIGAP